jgi:hypothetical protein
MKDDLRSLMLGDDAETSAPVRAPVTSRIPSDVQASRDQGRIGILQEEIRKRQPFADQGDARAIADIQALQREISGTTKGMVSAPQATPQPAPQSAPSGDNLRSLMAGDETSYQSTAGAGRGSYAGYNPTQNTNTQASKGNSYVADALQKAFQMKQAVPGLLASTADVTLGNVLPAVAGAVTYPFARAVMPEEEATALRGKVTSTLDKPFGKAFGMTEQPSYTGSASSQLMNYIGQNIDKGLDYLSATTGIAKGDVQSIVDSLTLAAPKVGGAIVQKAKPALATMGEWKRELQPTTASPGVENVVKADLVGMGAAKSNMNPYGEFTGEESARGPYPTIKSSKIAQDVPETEQQTRARVAQEITGSDKVRTGVITGNENALRNEYTEAKQSNQTPSAELLRKQIADEQNALSNYAKQRIDNTGADPNLVTDYERGQRINDAFAGDEGLTGFFKQEKQKLYNEAKTKVGDNPINTSYVDDLLNDKQFRASLGLKGNEGVATSAEQLINLAKNTGFKDEFGTVHPANSISAWDAVRKSLNNEWTKDNASVIRKVNDAIDKDVAAAGGGDLYKRADNLHKAEKKLFESKGIKTLFGNIDSNGVELATPYENIPKKLNNMTIDQWKHIHDVADSLSRGQIRGMDFTLDVPPELQRNAMNAKNEILGNIAREVYEAGANKVGVWNQNATNKILNARSEKIKYFDPAEQQAFHTLNYGGHIMPGVHAYEGAALQAQRMGMLTSKLPTIGREIGAATHIPFAATVLEKGGEKLQELSTGKSATKQAAELEKKMKQNAAKGSKLSDIGKQ